MVDLATVAISAASTGIALAGAMVSLRGQKDDSSRPYLLLIFAAFGGLSSLPLITAFVPALYVFYLPAMLPMLLVLPPAIYWFVKARTAESDIPIFQRRDSIFPLAGVFVTFGYWLLPEASRTTMLIEGELPPGGIPVLLAIVSFCLILCWVLTSTAYLLGTIRPLTEFRQRLKSIYSNTQAYELRWIDWLVFFLVILWLAVVSSLISDNLWSKVLLKPATMYLLTAVVLLFLIAFIASTSIPEKVDVTNEEDMGDIKYERSALSAEHAKRLAGRIDIAMREDALYLDSSLSLMKLSSHIGALPNMVSQTLNEEMSSTFYDYVARWRVDAAKPLILAGKASILEISVDVGFNSRSTFYKAFRRETGMTPKAFRDASIVD